MNPVQRAGLVGLAAIVVALSSSQTPESRPSPASTSPPAAATAKPTATAQAIALPGTEGFVACRIFRAEFEFGKRSATLYLDCSGDRIQYPVYFDSDTSQQELMQRYRPGQDFYVQIVE